MYERRSPRSSLGVPRWRIGKRLDRARTVAWRWAVLLEAMTMSSTKRMRRVRVSLLWYEKRQGSWCVGVKPRVLMKSEMVWYQRRPDCLSPHVHRLSRRCGAGRG